MTPLADLPNDVEQAWNLFGDNIVDTAVKVVGEKKRFHKLWLSEDAYRLIEMKKCGEINRSGIGSRGPSRRRL